MRHILKEFSRFDNNNDMYAATQKHISLHNPQLTESELQILDTISHYSAMHRVAQLTHPEMKIDTGRS